MTGRRAGQLKQEYVAPSSAIASASCSLRVLLALEIGDRQCALALANAYGRPSAAWTPARPLGIRMRIAFLRYHEGRMDTDAFRRVREVLVHQALRLGGGRDEIWRAAFGRECETAEEAREALSARPDGGR